MNKVQIIFVFLFFSFFKTHTQYTAASLLQAAQNGDYKDIRMIFNAMRKEKAFSAIPHEEYDNIVYCTFFMNNKLTVLDIQRSMALFSCMHNKSNSSNLAYWLCSPSIYHLIYQERNKVMYTNTTDMRRDLLHKLTNYVQMAGRINHFQKIYPPNY